MSELTSAAGSAAVDSLPVVVIGAGPVGLAAAAHLLERGLEPLVLEAGDDVGAAVRQWSHVRLFSPWEYDVDQAARRLLGRTGWQAPPRDGLPTGGELVSDYLEPLARALSGRIVTGARVVAVSRDGVDKTHAAGRADRPFLVRSVVDGRVVDHLARAVVDASGTWSGRNPLGTAGLPAPGEADAAELLLGPLPDVLGRDRARVEDGHVLVVGAGHSAANTLLSLVDLQGTAPATRITWAVRGQSAARAHGGGDADALPARGALGTRVRKAVEAGRVELLTSTTVASLEVVAGGRQVDVTLARPAGALRLRVDAVAGATGFRPDLDMLRELRLDLDPGLEAPSALAPLIDPEHHSCGTVPAHGATTLAHPEPDFFVVGMKSYGRAPTFLLATGYEQVRSVAAHLAGDVEAAGRLQLELPETGVCSTAQPPVIGFPTGLRHGRNAAVGASDPRR
ncbi:FAD-dependent oxidoreductase [Georgenia muralis]